MTVRRPRSICRNSYESRSIWFLGHHAPPFVSVRILEHKVTYGETHNYIQKHTVTFSETHNYIQKHSHVQWNTQLYSETQSRSVKHTIIFRNTVTFSETHNYIQKHSHVQWNTQSRNWNTRSHTQLQNTQAMKLYIKDLVASAPRPCISKTTSTVDVFYICLYENNWEHKIVFVLVLI